MNAVLRRVVVIQGHPDSVRKHFCHALADAYADGAREGGHEVRRIEIAHLDFPFLRTKEDFEGGTPPSSLRSCQADLGWAEHLVMIYPLWLGSMPALLKAFLEQVFRPGFAFEGEAAAGRWKKRLRGKSARIVVTMGMPALVYRWYFRAHSLKSLERNILGFCGIGPIRETLIGMVEAIDDHKRSRHLANVRRLGREVL
jgi:putative NADPH-quinone reductase